MRRDPTQVRARLSLVLTDRHRPAGWYLRLHPSAGERHELGPLLPDRYGRAWVELPAPFIAWLDPQLVEFRVVWRISGLELAPGPLEQPRIAGIRVIRREDSTHWIYCQDERVTLQPHLLAHKRVEWLAQHPLATDLYPVAGPPLADVLRELEAAQLVPVLVAGELVIGTTSRTYRPTAPGLRERVVEYAALIAAHVADKPVPCVVAKCKHPADRMVWPARPTCATHSVEIVRAADVPSSPSSFLPLGRSRRGSVATACNPAERRRSPRWPRPGRASRTPHPASCPAGDQIRPDRLGRPAPVWPTPAPPPCLGLGGSVGGTRSP